MHYDEVVLGRRSTRGFKADPVPPDVIREIVHLATRAPSSFLVTSSTRASSSPRTYASRPSRTTADFLTASQRRLSAMT